MKVKTMTVLIVIIILGIMAVKALLHFDKPVEKVSVDSSIPTVIKIIPVQPHTVPPEEAQGNAWKLVQDYFKGGVEVELYVSKAVEFIDQGENFESVSCPFCRQRLVMGWWQEAMNHASANSFSDLRLTVPCCLQETSLNELVYDWPAGFARFVLEIKGPVRDLDAKLLAELEETLGTPVKVVKATY